MSKDAQRLIDSAMQAMYYAICENTYPDSFNSIMGMLDDNGNLYSKAQLQSACMECAFIMEHGELPTWATVIESFECVGDSYVFVYANPLTIQ